VFMIYRDWLWGEGQGAPKEQEEGDRIVAEWAQKLDEEVVRACFMYDCREKSEIKMKEIEAEIA